MTGDTNNDHSAVSQRLLFAAFLAALAFVGTGLSLQKFLPEFGFEWRLIAQLALAAVTIYLVVRLGRRTPPEVPQPTLWVRAIGAVVVCSWWVALATWSLDFEIQANADRLGRDPNAPLVTLDHLAPSIFTWAFISFAAASFASNPRALWSTIRSVGGLFALLAPFVAAFYLSAPLVRVVVPEASPGLVNCLQLVVAIIIGATVIRVGALVMRIRPEAGEEAKTRSVPFRVVSGIAGLSFLISFFVLTYIGSNLPSQPNHPTGEYIVAERLKDGHIRYLTPTQSATEKIATYMLVGGLVLAFGLGYVLRRAKKASRHRE